MKPTNIPYELLRKITDDFSKDRILGSGSFGVVYKGVHANGEETAVKVLLNITGLDDTKFKNEFQNLARLKHQNIVQLVGYCNESVKQVAEYDGRKVIAEKIHTALCFEYVNNGSLGEHISDQNQGLTWHIRYEIIKGICEGLKYLREGLESPIWHLDLKPENILLDKEMMPKIADFGLSRLIGDERTRKTVNSVGTCGYWPPEYIRFQLITKEFDIFSLGVIITKIMIGTEGYYSCADMPPRKLVGHVHAIWRKKLQELLRPRLLQVHCKQVKACIEIASKCLKEDRHERPTIQEIVLSLNETEMMIHNLPLKKEQFGLFMWWRRCRPGKKDLDNVVIEQQSLESPRRAPLHMKLLYLENRVAVARLIFSAEVKVAMQIAQADTTEEFGGISDTTEEFGGISAPITSCKPWEVDLNETPVTQNKRLRSRVDALIKTVKLGRLYFPNCSAALDKFLEDNLPTGLDTFLHKGSPNEPQVKRMRFCELKEDVRKAFSKDKANATALGAVFDVLELAIAAPKGPEEAVTDEFLRCRHGGGQS